jgi:hypothetical protein
MDATHMKLSSITLFFFLNCTHAIHMKKSNAEMVEVDAKGNIVTKAAGRGAEVTSDGTVISGQQQYPQHALVSAAANTQDLVRARSKVPRDIFRAKAEGSIGEALNHHLKRSELNAEPCNQLSLQELQQFIAQVAPRASAELQQIYINSNDRRAMKSQTPDEREAEWSKLNGIATKHPHLYAPLQDAFCREAVNWWTHHLSANMRVSLRAANVTVPMLPEGPDKPCSASEGDSAEEQDYLCASTLEKTACYECHSCPLAVKQLGFANVIIASPRRRRGCSTYWNGGIISACRSRDQCKEGSGCKYWCGCSKCKSKAKAKAPGACWPLIDWVLNTRNCHHKGFSSLQEKRTHSNDTDNTNVTQHVRRSRDGTEEQAMRELLLRRDLTNDDAPEGGALGEMALSTQGKCQS